MSFHFKQVFSASFKEKLDLSQKKSIQPVLQRFELRPVFEFVEKTSIEKSKMFVPQRNFEGKKWLRRVRFLLSQLCANA